jgi:hypothetical protein
MSTLVLETELAAVQVTITDEKLIVELADGRDIVVPLEWYPRLINFSGNEIPLPEGWSLENHQVFSREMVAA